MPNQGHDKRTFRMDDPPWDRFVATCVAAGIDIPQDQLRTLVLWWIRTPGVTVKRPPRLESESD